MIKKLWIDTVTQTQVQPVVFELLYFKECDEYEVVYNDGELAISFSSENFSKAMNLMMQDISTFQQK